MARREYEGDLSGPSAGRKVGIGCGLFVMALILILAYKWVVGNANPSFTIPAKVAPSPNAFDTYRNASSMLINSKQVASALDPKNGVTLAQQEKLVASNAQALQTLRSGFSQEYMDMSPRSVTALFPYFAQYRSMARLLMLEDMVEAQKGDWNGAVNSDLDCLYMGEEIPHGSVLIGSLVGIACEAIGRKHIWRYIDHLDAAQTRKAIARLQAIQERHVPYADTITEEKYFGISALKEIFRDKKSLQGVFNAGNGNSGPPPIVYNLFYVVYSKDRIAHNYVNYMDQVIANSHQPYAAHTPDPPVPNDPINQILSPVFTQARFKDVENQTQNALLLVTLALHAYQVEHGRYPQSLQELTPAYLKQLPDDPFALKGTFQYHPSGTTYLLYSIGPDGKDDGGKVIDDPSRATSTSKDARYLVEPDSKGDIVAGKNF